MDLETAINFTVSILLTLHLLNRMAKPGGAAVNVASQLALHPKASTPIYCATKAGFQSFTCSIHHQLTPKCMPVIAVVAPLVETAMTDGYGTITLNQAAIEIIDAPQECGELIKIGKSKKSVFCAAFSLHLLQKMMVRA